MLQTLRSLPSRLRRNPGYVVLFLLAAGALYELVLKPEAGPTSHHRFVASDGSAVIEWEQSRPFTGYALPTADDRALYVYDVGRSSSQLTALDPSNGQTVWTVGRSGIRRILTNAISVFVATATSVTAYDPTNGYEQWSTAIGAGHVKVVPALSEPTLLIFYGGSVVELLTSNGLKLQDQARGDLLWVAGKVEIHEGPQGMFARDHMTGELLWRSYLTPFDVYETSPPVDVPPTGLLIHHQMEDLCMLDLQSGNVNWCTSGPFLSNAVIDLTRSRAYVLDSGFDLVALDISTGAAEIISSFPIDSPGTGPTNMLYEYWLATSGDRLFLYLGDSWQLLALSIR